MERTCSNSILGSEAEKRLKDCACEDGELVLRSLLVILEDQPVTFNNKHLSFYLKYLQLSRLRIRCRETQMR